MFGLLFLLIGLIWFGVLNLRQPVLVGWRWLPLVTGLMGFIGFFLFDGDGEEITATFLFFRTLFALGLIGSALRYGWKSQLCLRWWPLHNIQSALEELAARVGQRW
jgi:hypothetical protein